LRKITHSPEETIEFAKEIGSKLKGGDVVAYIGGLGAGKTTFTRGLAIGMGLEDDVTSPTFAIVNEYRGKINLYHFDMYRIMNTESLETTGFFDYLSDDNVLAIEWSENIKDALDENTIYITINKIDDNTREIIIDGGERFC
jgi:tRNA threonylcarbamoyladenosine biosynthesis protein TsaE